MIYVISDTHLTGSHLLPAAFVNKIKRDDIILHLGDMTSYEILEYFSGLCRLEAVFGNCDMPDVRRALKDTRIIESGRHRIGMVHGNGALGDTLRRAKHEFADKADIVLFGHTHAPYHSRQGKVLLFNPGSLKENGEGHRSYGILHLDDEPWGEVIEL